jgi:hypothetical protein
MPNKRVKPTVDYPQVSVTVTPQDFDFQAFTVGDKYIGVAIPEEVFPVVRSMIESRSTGKLSITVTIAGYVK